MPSVKLAMLNSMIEHVPWGVSRKRVSEGRDWLVFRFWELLAKRFSNPTVFTKKTESMAFSGSKQAFLNIGSDPFDKR